MAARDNLAVKNGLKLDFVERVFDVPFHRSPFSLQNMGAYRELKKIVDAGGYDVIHCNTPVGESWADWRPGRPERRGHRCSILPMASISFKALPGSIGPFIIPLKSGCAGIRTS